MLDIQPRKSLFNVVEIPVKAKGFEEGEIGVALGVPKFFLNIFCNVYDLLPMVSLFMQFNCISKRLQISCADGSGQVFNLIAGIIKVVFANDLKSCPL